MEFTPTPQEGVQQPQQTQRKQDYLTDYSSNMYGKQQLEFLLEEQKELLRTLKMQFRLVQGDIEDEETWQPIAKGVKPMMNDLGIAITLSLVQTRTSKLFKLSNYDSSEIETELKSLAKTLTILYNYKKDEFELNEEYLNMVVNIVFDCAKATMKRALRGRESDNVYERTSFNESSSYNPYEPQQGIGGMMKRIFRRGS